MIKNQTDNFYATATCKGRRAAYASNKKIYLTVATDYVTKYSSCSAKRV